MSIQGVPTLCEFKDNNSRKFECVNLLLGAELAFTPGLRRGNTGRMKFGKCHACERYLCNNLRFYCQTQYLFERCLVTSKSLCYAACLQSCSINIFLFFFFF